MSSTQFEHLASKVACMVYKPQNIYSNYYLWITENIIVPLGYHPFASFSTAFKGPVDPTLVFDVRLVSCVCVCTVKQ